MAHCPRCKTPVPHSAAIDHCPVCLARLTADTTRDDDVAALFVGPESHGQRSPHPPRSAVRIPQDVYDDLKALLERPRVNPQNGRGVVSFARQYGHDAAGEWVVTERQRYYAGLRRGFAPVRTPNTE